MEQKLLADLIITAYEIQIRLHISPALFQHDHIQHTQKTDEAECQVWVGRVEVDLDAGGNQQKTAGNGEHLTRKPTTANNDSVDLILFIYITNLFY